MHHVTCNIQSNCSISECEKQVLFTFCISMHEEEAKNTINENFQNSSRNRFRRKNIRKAFFVSRISQIPLRAVWPDGVIILEIFGHLQQWKFAQWHKPWSSLVEGCIGPIVKLFYDKPTKKYPAHACEHSIHVWLLGWSSCSPPSTKELHAKIISTSRFKMLPKYLMK